MLISAPTNVSGESACGYVISNIGLMLHGPKLLIHFHPSHVHFSQQEEEKEKRRARCCFLGYNLGAKYIAFPYIPLARIYGHFYWDILHSELKVLLLRKKKRNGY